MSAFDKCSADVATAAQTAGSRDLRSIIVAIRFSQVGEGAAQAALATQAARKPSPRRHTSLSVYIYTCFAHAPSVLHGERRSTDRTDP